MSVRRTCGHLLTPATSQSLLKTVQLALKHQRWLNNVTTVLLQPIYRGSFIITSYSGSSWRTSLNGCGALNIPLYGEVIGYPIISPLSFATKGFGWPFHSYTWSYHVHDTQVSECMYLQPFQIKINAASTKLSQKILGKTLTGCITSITFYITVPG